MTRGAQTWYFFQNALGSTSEIADANGQLMESYKYNPHGQVSILDPSRNPRASSICANRFLFTGREYYQELGLYNYRNRFYSPELGRFLQPDPIGFAGGDANVYRYCGGDPVNLTDPFGLTGVFYYNQSGNNVNFYVPVSYGGPAAYYGLGNSLSSAASSHWTGSFGRYNTTMTVYSPTGPYATNAVTVSYGTAQGVTQGNHITIYIPGVTNNPGGVLAHELAHIMGLHHSQDSQNPDQGIMQNINLPPTEDQIHTIVAGNRGQAPDLRSPFENIGLSLRTGGHDGGGGGENGISNGGSAPSNPFTNNSGYGFMNSNGDSVFGSGPGFAIGIGVAGGGGGGRTRLP